MIDKNIQSPTHNLQFNCPDCGGVLLPIQEGDFVHFQCEVGHRYSPQTLLDAQRESVEYSIWESIRGVTETTRLIRKLAAQDSQAEPDLSASQAMWHIQQQDKVVAFLRQALTELNKQEDETD